MWRSLDRPFHFVALLPVARPTPEQLQVVRELSVHHHTNLLEVRDLVRSGGFSGFGELLAEDLVRVVARLEEVGIPHRVEPSPTLRGHL